MSSISDPPSSTQALVTTAGQNSGDIAMTTLNGKPKLPDDEDATVDSTETEKAGSKVKSDKAKKEEELNKQIQALSVPGYTLSEDGVFTVVKRTKMIGRSGTFPARIARWLLNSDKWLPALFNFTKESFQLAPWRMLVLLLSKTIISIAPAARLWASTHMLSLVDEAIHTGHVDKMKLCLLVGLGGFLSTGLRNVELFFAKNNGILERKFVAMITSRMLGSMARLDWLAATDPMNMKLLLQAGQTVQSGSDQAFKVVSDVVKVFTSLFGVISQTVLLKYMFTRDSADLVAISLVANFVRSAEWLFRGDPGVHSGVTNYEYQRMQDIWNESINRQPEEVLLDLPSYFAKEHDKANVRLGDLWTYRLKEQSGLARAMKIMTSLSEPIVYALFAVRAAARRGTSSTPSSLFSETFSIAGLKFIQEASAGLAEEVGGFFYVLDDVRQHCSQVLQFYKALDLKPILKQPETPTPYVKQIISTEGPGPGLQGMKVELNDVSFKYPDADRKALDKVSFTVNPGSLCCIVGFNGAGKSTLINLISRVVDPTSGTVFINGVDARQYDTKDLYSRISCHFQQTYPSDFTIREWLHMGDISDENDAEKMEQCLRVTGANKVIARFPKGLDARLGPYPANDTPQSLLKEYVLDNRTGGLDPWDEDYGKTVEREIEIEEEYEEDVIGSRKLKNKDCAFSPGEWSKLCFARSLMKRTADLRIFDEPSAALDPIASRAVFDKIESLRGGCTVIHITHDLAACIKADQVILFEEGKNVESGTHEGLLAKTDSKYRQFYLASIGQGDDDENEDEDEDEEDEDEDEEDEDEDEEDGGNEPEEADDADDEETGESNNGDERSSATNATDVPVVVVHDEGTIASPNEDVWEDEEDEDGETTGQISELNKPAKNEDKAKGERRVLVAQGKPASREEMARSGKTSESDSEEEEGGLEVEGGESDSEEDNDDKELGEDSGFEGSSQSSVCAE